MKRIHSRTDAFRIFLAFFDFLAERFFFGTHRFAFF